MMRNIRSPNELLITLVARAIVCSDVTFEGVSMSISKATVELIAAFTLQFVLGTMLSILC
jgi:hypothetical protein